jgi:proline iminopeptidase
MHVTTPGANLAVRIYAGDSEPIILLHGGPGGYDYLGPIADMLAPQHHVVSYDQRGGGQSSRNGPYRIDNHIKDLEIIRQHIGAGRIHLFGHSWGGLLAQLYASTYPQHVASMVLCSSAAGLGGSLPDRNFVLDSKTINTGR